MCFLKSLCQRLPFASIDWVRVIRLPFQSHNRLNGGHLYAMKCACPHSIVRYCLRAAFGAMLSRAQGRRWCEWRQRANRDAREKNPRYHVKVIVILSRIHGNTRLGGSNNTRTNHFFGSHRSISVVSRHGWFRWNGMNKFWANVQGSHVPVPFGISNIWTNFMRREWEREHPSKHKWVRRSKSNATQMALWQR